jgi:hypothetical protein
MPPIGGSLVISLKTESLTETESYEEEYRRFYITGNYVECPYWNHPKSKRNLSLEIER